MKTIFKLIAFISTTYSLLAPAAIAAYTLPEYQKTTLKNGVTLYLMEQKEVPLIDATVIFNAGATQDGQIKGLANMTSANMLFGAGERDKAAFEEALEFVGAEFTTSTTLDYSKVNASFAQKDQLQMLTLLADVIRAPKFEQQEFEKFKKRYLGSLKRQKESPRNVISDYYKQLIFENHPYSSPVGGDAPSVELATLKDLKRFYATWFRPENAAIVLVGDFNSKDMAKQIKSLFDDWHGSGDGGKLQTIGQPDAFTEARVLLVNKGNARESTFFVGGQGIPRSNPDYVSLSVINTILGARFTSWLNDELRVNSGLTYGARSQFSALKAAGTFHIYTFTATENTQATLDLALKTYARLWQQGVDAETLTSAKAYVKGLFPPRYETSRQLAGLLSDMYIYGFDERFINEFQANVDKLDVAKSKHLIAKYFPQDNLQFTVIGKADEIRETLKQYGKVIETDITTPGFNF